MSLFDKLPAKLSFLTKKTEETQYYFSLQIGLSEVVGSVWSIFGNKIDILGSATTSYSGTEDLLEKGNAVLDEALGVFEIEPQKILFGVPDSWLLDDNLKEPYLKLLRRMVKEYGLEPMAYVATSHAISHLLQKEDGTPPTAILLSLDGYLEAVFIKGGKVLESRHTMRSDQLFDDIAKIFSQFDEIDVLPSKILLNLQKKGESVEKIKDELMTYPWMQKLPFLHFPKIEVLGEGTSNEALVYAGAVEINPQVSLRSSFAVDHKNLIKEEQLEKIAAINPLKESRLEAKEAAISRLKLKRVKDATGDTENLVGDDAIGSGFVKGDIHNRRKPESYHSDNLEQSAEPFSLDNESEDESLNSPSEEKHSLPPLRRSPHTNYLPEQTVENFTGNTPHSKKRIPLPSFAILNKILPVLHRLTEKMGRFGLAPLAVVVVVILGISAYILLVKASITVYVEPKILENQSVVVADPSVTQVDQDKKIIPGTAEETTVTGSASDTATGQKQIGNPATGKIVIYNKTNFPVNFSKGTTISSANSLQFTLDVGVQVASQSSTTGADFQTITSPGKSSPISVTAMAIGPDSNLPAGTVLNLTGYTSSQAIAKVDETLSGGTSKNVTVVTSDDQKRLQAKLLDQLRVQAVDDLHAKLQDNKKLLPEALLVVDSKFNFNKQINDQASDFTVTGTVHFKGTAYSETDLRTFVVKLVDANVPNGYELNLSDTETSADVSKVEKDGKLIFNAKFKAKLLPKYNVDGLKKQISGKSIAEATMALKNMENVLGADIKIVPNLPSPIARIPFLAKNITIVITPK